MWSTIIAAVHTIWAWLPALTIGLRFGAALVGFGVATTVAVRRLRRHLRRRRT